MVKLDLFKGIALFTPGGDLVYCIDPSKQGYWHLNLCLTLQEWLGLPEPPHFLVPGYTATVDRWRQPQSGEIETIAEIYPPVASYQSLLNLVFGLDDCPWQLAPWQEANCHPLLLDSYRSQFPQLWQCHQLIVRSEATYNPDNPSLSQGYVLRLFVSGNNTVTKQTLETLHQVLEQGLGYPYTLKVIDISQDPEQAEANHISAIPTLVRVWPQPVKRIVGGLEDFARVLQIIAVN